MDVAIAVDQTVCRDEDPRWGEAVREILAAAGIRRAAVSVAVVDDATIERLNRRYLQHDYPTDVLSFPFQCEAEALEGEIVVSAETAARQARRLGWRAEDELLLYVIHGALHLVGHDDQTPAGARRMRNAERKWLDRFHVGPPPQEPSDGEPSDGEPNDGEPIDGDRRPPTRSAHQGVEAP